ncbi:TPA: phage holin [Streptococcus pyogenes]|nr:phage holin [Streptococcus pyogenes]HES7072289.1 phage holin [Streptococcus pyogenes]HES7811539.1 phage holin [Streptococcus pyogenes]
MINLKLRLQNKVTLMAILGAIFLLAQQLGIKLPSNIADIANTAVTLLVLLGVVTDPTTKGLLLRVVITCIMLALTTF